MLRIARQRGLEADVEVGLQLLAAVLPERGVADDSGGATHVLEFARYGPSELDQRPELRAAYYVALVTMRLRRLGDRTRYAGRALVAGGRRSVLASVATGLALFALGAAGVREHRRRRTAA